MNTSSVKPSTFRVAAFVLGAVVLAVAVSAYDVFWVAVLAGVLFGAGGYVVDHLTGNRLVRGQLSSWALAAGGGVIAFYWSRALVVEGRSVVPLWLPEAEYISAVCLCWGALMFVPLGKRHEA